MAAIPYMPLYVADYLADAAHLSTLEHGAYLLMIMTYWQRGEALPNDDKKLARICRVGPREWSRMKPVLSEFFKVDCDNWSHSRIESELHNVRAKSLKKRAGGLARAKQMHSNCSTPAKLSDTDTDTETDKEENNYQPDKPVVDGFCGRVIRLTKADFDRWQRSYPDLDLTAALQSRDDWLATAADKSAKAKWFMSTSNWLAAKQKETKAQSAIVARPVC